MAEKPGRDKSNATPPRRALGFQRAGGLIGAQVATIAARRGFAKARLDALWPEIAGPEIAAICEPTRLVAARGPAGGLLTLAVAPAHGPELQMMLPLLRERINAVLGPGAVGRILLVQAVGPRPAAPARTQARAEQPPPPDLGSLAGPVSSIGDDELRRALETLARNVLSRPTTSRKPEAQP